MKVFEVMNKKPERVSSCMQQYMAEAFNEMTVPVDGSIVDLDEIVAVMRDITAKKRDVGWQQEETVLEDLLSRIDELYLPKDKELLQEIDRLEDIILRNDENIMQTVQAVQKYTRLLRKHIMTEDEWWDSDAAKEAEYEAREACEEQIDPYGYRGVSPSDFY